jgi:hypothetical protein
LRSKRGDKRRAGCLTVKRDDSGSREREQHARVQ